MPRADAGSGTLTGLYARPAEQPEEIATAELSQERTAGQGPEPALLER